MNSAKELINKTLIIVVTYSSDILNEDTILCLIQLLKKNRQAHFNIYIHDNSPKPTPIKFDFEGNNITYKHTPQNIGISQAYNAAALFAKEKNLDYLLFFDQDTTFDSQIFNDYFHAVVANKNIELFAPTLMSQNSTFFSPVRFRFNRGRGIALKKNQGYSLNEYAPLNSGILVSLSSFLSCGGYNENVKLDFSDFQFILKYKEKNADFFLTKLVFTHQFSNEVIFDEQSLLNRFSIFCTDAKNCYRIKIYDNLVYTLITLGRALKLSMKAKSYTFFYVWIRKYLLA